MYEYRCLPSLPLHYHHRHSYNHRATIATTTTTNHPLHHRIHHESTIREQLIVRSANLYSLSSCFLSKLMNFSKIALKNRASSGRNYIRRLSINSDLKPSAVYRQEKTSLRTGEGQSKDRRRPV